MTRQISRETIEKAYGEEKDAYVSRRMLLVLKVRYDVRGRVLRREGRHRYQGLGTGVEEACL
jgi:hypothetical protein